MGTPPTSPSTPRFQISSNPHREHSMRYLWLVTCLVLIAANESLAKAQGADPWKTTAGTEIGAMLQQFSTAARSRDAKAYASVYAEDAMWTNAFGDKRRGRTEIETFYTRLFAHPGERDTKSTMIGGPTLQVLRPDVAVVQWLVLGEGQRDDAGKLLPNRKTHHSLVVTKEQNRWVISNHFIMDEREPIGRAIPK